MTQNLGEPYRNDGSLFSFSEVNVIIGITKWNKERWKYYEMESERTL